MDLFAPRTIELAPGGAFTRTNDRHSFWGGTVERTPSTRTPEQIAKHEAKLIGRRRRWVTGLAHNRCISVPKFLELTKHITT